MSNSELATLKPRRRWLQFSLRGFLILLTIGCLLLGWRVDRARRRGKAIDMLIAEGGWVTYQNAPQFLAPSENHFWHDLKGVPVLIEFDLEVGPGPKAASILSSIDRIAELDLTEWIETDLQRIESLDADEVLVFYSTTTEGIELLRRKIPHCRIVKAYRKPAL